MSDSSTGSTAVLAVSPLTLEDIRATAQRKFPVGLLKGCRSALCLFGAASKGKCDLIHLLDAGVPHVTVIDDSSSRMAELARVFPAAWEYKVENCLAACQNLLAKRRLFDIVVCDGSAGVIDHIWEELLPYLGDLAVRKALVKLNDDYAALQGTPATPAGVASLAKQLHGADLVVDDLVLRSRGKGGTYWAILSKRIAGTPLVETAAGVRDRRTSQGARRFDEIAYGRAQCVLLDDQWGLHGCPQDAPCRDNINKFRINVVQKESQSIYRIYTSRAFSQLASAEIDRQKLAAACIDLQRFVDADEFLEAARNATSKKGRTNREISKAQRNGFYVRPFDQERFVPDLCAIHGSKEIRGGKPMKEHYVTAGDAKIVLPGAAESCHCQVHHNRFWGVFQAEPGHNQGSVVTDERLVAYIHLYRHGNHCWYSRIMGHGEYLKFGTMYLLHSVLMEKLLASRESGLRYLFYGGINSGPKDGSLRAWKSRNLFEPRYLIYDEAGDWKAQQGMHYR